MAFAATANVIRSRFATEFATARPTVPIHYDNVAGDPPAASSWVRLTVVEGDSFQVAMGSTRRFRDTGVAIVQVFTPLGSGDGEAREIADDVQGIFKGLTVSGVVFRKPRAARIGPDGRFYQVNVTIPFQADEIE
ncbi:MAG: phage tail terminator-like protein [Alphaproteobacteria bacterium]|jgi:hypothetical protein